MDPKYRPSRTLPATTSTSPKAPLTTSEDAAEELEKAKAILDVVQHSARFTRAVALAKPIESFRGRTIILAALALPLLVLTVYTYVARPAWVFGADPVAGSVERREAYQRFVMSLVAHRLDYYRATNQGQLPQSLIDVGEEWPGIGYTVVDREQGIYELHGTGVLPEPIKYRSDQRLPDFVGGSTRFLRDWNR
jgi:hypothetical protein